MLPGTSLHNPEFGIISIPLALFLNFMNKIPAMRYTARIEINLKKIA